MMLKEQRISWRGLFAFSLTGPFMVLPLGKALRMGKSSLFNVWLDCMRKIGKDPD